MADEQPAGVTRRAIHPAFESSKYSGWPEEASARAEQVMEAHGGWRAWESLGAVKIEVDHVGGLLWRAKGAGRTFPPPHRFEVTPRRQSVTFPSWPSRSATTCFESGSVAIDGDKALPPLTPSGRLLFDGAKPWTAWTPPMAAYFVGYSMANYHALPFLIAFCELHSFRIRARGGATWKLKLPNGLDAHARLLTVIADPDGRLSTLRYNADVVGRLPRVVHAMSDWYTVRGVRFPRRRVVRPSLAGVPVGPAAIETRFTFPDANGTEPPATPGSATT